MSQHYAFKFYSPKPILTAERTAALLRTFAATGFRVKSYVADGALQRVEGQAVFDAGRAIAADGSCLVSLSTDDVTGYTRFLFQSYPPEAKGAQASVAVDEDVFDADPTVLSAALVELAKTINLHLPAFFGWGDHVLRLDQMEDALRFDRIGALTWANLFGPEMVRRIGRDRLMALPIYRVQTFKQGVLCLLTPLPGQPLPATQVERIHEQWPDCALPLA